MTRSEIHQEFLHLQKSEARTIILVTHDLREALKLAQEVVILNRGNLVQRGTCAEIVQSPADEFVETFLNSQLED